jgi:phage-related protein (TIGR01555 family)
VIKLIRKLFGGSKTLVEKHADPDGYRADPLDMVARGQHGSVGWEATQKSPIQRVVSDFPVYGVNKKIGDAATKHMMVGDDGEGAPFSKPDTGYLVPEGVINWYGSQGFLGYQILAIMAQQWLIDKACSMAGDDAIRNGWTIRGDSGDEITGETYDLIHSYDKKFGIKANLSELNRFNNIFGIRVAIFDVRSDDPLYYEKPFNIDGVTEGSYRGISQIDPIWMMPMMSSDSMSNPASKNFYEPEYWIISGKKYHRSHIVVARGPQPADILKPTYIFGGVSMVQRIYERVYAAERTANEAPLLSMNKRTTAIHVDLDKVAAQEISFMQRLMIWVKYRDNHAIKVLGKDETMDQYDTSLADFDNVIMSQYQLVAAIAKVPATKLLGTPPKGFNATGEFEMISYHEELESVQEHIMTPMLDRHYLLLGKSLNLETQIHTDWNPVDSITTIQKADLNQKKAETDVQYITAGVLSPDEARNRLRQDRYANYSTITEEAANTTPGLSPENITGYEEAGAEVTKGEAAIMKSAAAQENVQTGLNPSGTEKGEIGSAPGGRPGTASAAAPNGTGEEGDDLPPGTPSAAAPLVSSAPSAPSGPAPALDVPQIAAMLRALLAQVEKLDPTEPDQTYAAHRSTFPSTARSVRPSVTGLNDQTPADCDDAESTDGGSFTKTIVTKDPSGKPVEKKTWKTSDPEGPD